MYPLFYREDTYKINITIDDFIHRMDNDLFKTSSNALKHKKQDRIDKYIPLQGEINLKEKKIKGIEINSKTKTLSTANIYLEYYVADNENLLIKISFRESIYFFLIYNLLGLIFIIFILPLKAFFIFLLLFYPFILLNTLYPFFEINKIVIKIFEEYFSKQGIEYVKVKVIKYSILDFIFKKVKI